MALNAILTAGGRLPASLRKLADSPVKALLQVGGRTLLEAAAEAARNCPAIDRIVVVGGDEVKAHTPDGCDYVRQGEGVVDNIENAFNHLGGPDHDYLIVSPDMPFVTADDLAALVDSAGAECDIGFPLIRQSPFLEAYPGAPNRFESIDGERATMGSTIYATGPSLRMNFPLARDLYNSRKYPWRLAIMFGFPVLWGYITGNLKSEVVERRMSLLMDSRVRALWVDRPALAYDIDNLENYEFALKVLQAEVA